MPSVILAGTTTGTALSLTSDTSGELQIRTNNGSTTAMTLTTAGNVGVGTTTPTNYGAGYKSIAINGTSSGILELQAGGVTQSLFVSDASDLQIQANGNRPIRLFTNSAERMRIDSSGNVGIGTSSPSGKLDVAGNAIVSAGGFFQVRSNGKIYVNDSGNTNFGIISNNGTGSNLTFETGSAERMRITSSGDVGIGTTTAFGAAANRTVLSVNGTNASIISMGSGGTQRSYFYADSSSVELASVGAIPLILSTNGTEQARISANGFFQFNSGYGSVVPAYGCRAWVNFNGTGTVSTRGSGNISSIGDNGAGDYTINFATAMPDANYTWVGTCDPTSVQTTDSATKVIFGKASTSPSAGSFRCVTASSGFGLEDFRGVFIAVFR